MELKIHCFHQLNCAIVKVHFSVIIAMSQPSIEVVRVGKTHRKTTSAMADQFNPPPLPEDAPHVDLPPESST